ncbi:Eco57I restriction-modification methylase domain-containing protein [Actinoplanes sp. GCM10030250]|uniref:Eco57I restriction-modification methylase domain-containing protein n=1 Tax=Actinoplanes sp. GCM10030250 TaxID=3273376 RepID=UPI00361CCFD2
MRTRSQAASPADSHRTWLELVETDGPFLAVPPLLRVWPHGMPGLEPARRDTLRTAKATFEAIWEKTDSGVRLGEAAAVGAYREARDAWVRTVLERVAGWQRHLEWPPVVTVPGARASSPNQAVTVIPAALLRGPDGVGALVHVVDRVDSLHQAGGDGWAATPIDRLEQMLRDSGVPIGVVTDGRWWALVCAGTGTPVASGIVDSQTWIEEGRARDAFLALLDRQYLIGGAAEERLPRLFADSVAEAEEITEALGAQVRRAVETLVQAFSETAADALRRGRPDPLPEDPHEVYRSAVTVMMRVVFLLFAEQRGLLPTSALFTEGYGISGELDRLEHRARHEHEEALDSTYLTWHRLLATSQALFGGASFENMRMPAYGGSLFDPGHMPLLTELGPQGTLAVPISDRVMFAVLRAVQVAELKGRPARRISFRDVDVEQIGYIYEGLLGYSCTVVRGQAVLGLVGTPGQEPEIPLGVLERLASDHPEPRDLATAVITWTKQDQPGSKTRTAATLARLLTAGPGEQADRMLRTVTSNARLRGRIRRFAGIVRADLRDRPVVVLDGGLLVIETPSRRHSGAHYTPRALAEEIVHHALEPLCYSPGPYQTNDSSEWRLRSAEEILALKVADIACGSGAFLVSAARYLGARLVEAWAAEQPGAPARSDILQHAIRQVVARCLYGADINPMAVEMCKLSLWLVSLDRDLPFSFVDDKVLCGNSLLGLTSLDQLRHLHINPPKHQQASLFDPGIDDIVTEVTDLRRRLATEVDERDPQRNTSAKQRQLGRIRDLTAQLRRVADGVVAAGLALGGNPGRALDDTYRALQTAVALAFPANGHPESPAMLDAIIDEGLTPTVPTEYPAWQPLHWALELPDVVLDRGGFDAVIGNPPFLGGQKLTGALGTNVRDWFINVAAEGARGSADLVAYFLLQAHGLLRSTGTIGIIGTNTIAQGDTRQVGLDRLVERGTEISRAVRSRKWPASGANLEYAAVWATRDSMNDLVRRFSDDAPVKRISTLLEAEGAIDGRPKSLQENRNVAFQGCIVNGTGFVLDPAEAQEWIAADERYRDVVRPYLSGEDLNASPDCRPRRWVIDFGTRELEECRAYRLPFQRVERLVKPERRNSPRPNVRDKWWQFEAVRPRMRTAIEPLTEVLAIARVSKTVMPVRVRTDQVFNDKTVVFITGAFTDQAFLSSSVHQMWAVKYGTTLRTDPQYTPSEVWETFPLPPATARAEAAGRELDATRRAIMLRRQSGLTRLYNLINDPEIGDESDADVRRLREIHVELDQAVAEAYGWGDLDMTHEFDTYRQVRRWSVSPATRVEILDRLLAENHRRAANQTPVASRKGHSHA